MKKSTLLVLSDVDGTLVNGSLVLDHACYLDTKGIINTNGLSDEWQHDPKNESLITKLADAYKDAIVGKTVRSLQVSRFLSEKLSADDGVYKSSLSRLLRTYRAGASVHLVSGSPQFLLNPFAKWLRSQGNHMRLSHGSISATGSQYFTDADGKLNGEIEGMFHASAKRAAVARIIAKHRACYGDNFRVTAFGDTASDMPLLTEATHGNAYLVDPSKVTLKVYRNMKVKVL